MKVLTITGDRSFTEGHSRFDLQARAVDALRAVYWGRDSLWSAFGVQGTYDVVTAQDPFWRGVVGWIVARRFRASLNVQVHADISAQSVWKRFLARFVLARADSIRVVSNNIQRQVEKMQTRATIHVLPLYVDGERFSSVERVPSASPLLLWMGRFESEKDPLFALSVFIQVQKEIPNVRLVMLGAGALGRRLKEEAASLPVEFPGWTDPLPYLKEAHVVFSTSRAESWGVSIVEALAAGVPVVAPDVGVAREAGARVVPREDIADEVIRVLKEEAKGKLKIDLLSEEEWLLRWRENLECSVESQ